MNAKTSYKFQEESRKEGAERKQEKGRWMLTIFPFWNCFVFLPDANHSPSWRGHSTSADGLVVVAVTDVKERVLVPNEVEQVAGEEGALER